MKKLIPFLFFTILFGEAYAQDASSPRVPQIRSERKELRREKFAAREIKQEIRIRHAKREIQHVRNGKHHDWRPVRPVRPVRNMPHRRPSMGHRRR